MRRLAERVAPVALALGIAVAAFAVLNRLNPPVPLTDDGIRDQLLARDCAELTHCHTVGAPASLLGLFHGAFWIDLLAVIELLGGTPTADRIAVLALAALSVATTFAVVWRWIRPTVAVPAAVLFGGVLAAERYLSDLINPSVSPLPDVLVAGALATYALSGQRRFLLIAAVALAVAVDVHVAALGLVPAFLVIALIGRPPSWRLSVAALGVGAVTYGLVSSAALRANLIHICSAPGALLAVLVLAGIAGLAVMTGPRFRAAPRDTRAWIVGAVLVAPVAVSSTWLFIWQRQHFNGWYPHSIFAPAAVLAAAVLCVPFEVARRWVRAAAWVPSVAAAVAVVLVVRDPSKGVVPHSTGDSWSADEASIIAGALTQRGWSYESVVFRLQAAACRELLLGMSLAAPPPGAEVDQSGRQIQVVKISSGHGAEVAERGDLVTLAPGTDAVVREVASWLRPESLRACRAPLDSAQPLSCAPAHLVDLSLLDRRRFLFQMRASPEIHHLDVAPPYVARYEIPLVPTAAGRRDVALADTPHGACDWRITQVTGVEVDGELPARRVRLHSRDGTPGTLVVERAFGTAGPCAGDIDGRFPPCLWDTEPDDALFATAVR